MKKIKVRKDLMSKTDYAKAFNVSRPTLDKMIDDGQVAVEEISGKHYIKVV